MLRCGEFCGANATLKILYTKFRFDNEGSITRMHPRLAKFYSATDRLQSGGVAFSHLPSKNRLMIVAQDAVTRGPRDRIDDG